MTNRIVVVAVFAFLLGVVFSPLLIPSVSAGGAGGWTDWQVKEALRLLEKIADK